MVDQLIRQMKSEDLDQRRQAIVGLANSGDSRSVALLHEIATTDPVSALRDLAAKAELHAKKKLAQQPQQASAPALSGDSLEARGQLNNAFSSKANGDSAGAIAALRQAIDLDPFLTREPEVRQLASELNGQPPELAITSLLGYTRKAQKKPSGGKTFGDVIVNAGLATVILFALSVGYIYMSGSLLKEYAGSSSSAVLSQSPDASRLMNQLQSFTPSQFMILALEGAGVLVVGAIILFSVMYVAALMMGGSASIFEFVTTMLSIDAVVMAITLGTVLLTYLAVHASPGLQRSVADLVSLVSGLTALGSAIAYVVFAARVSEFSIMKGIGTVLSPSFFACGLCCLLSILARSPR